MSIKGRVYRRRFLTYVGSAGATGIAGCQTSKPPQTASQPTPQRTSSPTAPSPARTPTTVETDGETPTSSPTPEPGTVDVTVAVPENTPDHDTVYFDVINEKGGIHESIELEEVEPNRWHRTIYFPQYLDQEIWYRYGRGSPQPNGGTWDYTGAEEFVPDAKTGHRTLAVTNELITLTDTVEKWRWLPAPGEEISQSIPTSAPNTPFVPRLDGHTFQTGVTFADFWWGNFDPLLASTHERLSDHKFGWIEVAPPFNYDQVNPTPVLNLAGYSEEDMEFHLDKIRNDGFQLVLAPQICCTDPSSGSFADAWWDHWYREYEDFVMYFARLAEKYEAEVLIFDSRPMAQAGIDTQSDFYDRVGTILAKAKAEFSGLFGTKFIWGGMYDDSLGVLPDRHKLPFLDFLDVAAVSVWVGVAKDGQPSQRLMNENARTGFDRYLKPFQEALDVPIILLQIAYPSVDGGATGSVGVFEPEIQLWEPYSDKYALDLDEQAMAHEAILHTVANTDYVIGTYPFAYWPDSFPLSKEFNVRGKPAEAVYQAWYEAASNG